MFFLILPLSVYSSLLGEVSRSLRGAGSQALGFGSLCTVVREELVPLGLSPWPPS